MFFTILLQKYNMLVNKVRGVGSEFDRPECFCYLNKTFSRATGIILSVLKKYPNVQDNNVVLLHKMHLNIDWYES